MSSMIKLVGVLKRKVGMSRDDFITHFEMRHVPLTMQLTAMGHDFRRNYLRVAAPELEGETEPEYDVITELWFKNEQTYDEFVACMKSPEIKARLTLEEDRFLDRAGCRTFIVDEFITETSHPGVRR
jgi:uncharacterized protein (TIGR02118 family)